MKPWRIKLGHALRLIANWFDEKDLNSHAAKQLKQRYRILDTKKTMTAIRANLLNPQFPHKELLIRQRNKRELWRLTIHKHTFYFVWAPDNKAFVTFLTKETVDRKLQHLKERKLRLQKKWEG